MESIAYLSTQLDRMSPDQRALVNRVARLPDGTQPTKMEEERLAQLYLWLHGCRAGDASALHV